MVYFTSESAKACFLVYKQSERESIHSLRVAMVDEYGLEKKYQICLLIICKHCEWYCYYRNHSHVLIFAQRLLFQEYIMYHFFVLCLFFALGLYCVYVYNRAFLWIQNLLLIYNIICNLFWIPSLIFCINSILLSLEIGF